MSDHQLMQTIFSAWHVAIAGAVQGTAVPAELVAALVANESAGNANAQRFEPATFGHLCEVLAGKRQLFAPRGISRPLAQSDLLSFVVTDAGGLASFAFRENMQRVAELATSFGLVQIMGWHWIEFNRPASSRPEDQLAFAAVLLAYFANKYTLDLSADSSKIFSCWNTGEPSGHTYDPAYVPNGLTRLNVYRSIAGEGSTAT